MSEIGPVYGVELIDSLPINGNGMRQACPSRSDLDKVRRISERTVAGYEAVLAHYREAVYEVKRLQREVDALTNEAAIREPWALKLEEENERLLAIVNKIRATADGAPICIGDDIWSNDERGAFQWVATDLSVTVVSGEFHGEHVIFEPYDKCYSTREAAEKARTM